MMTTTDLRTINQQNHKFWRKQSELLLRWADDYELVVKVLNGMERDSMLYPIGLRRPFEKAIADAEQERLPRSRSRKGGSRSKTDSLQLMILKTVREEPGIDRRRLFLEIKRQQGRGTIVGVSEESIEFVDHNRKLKKAPVSGLKDRLFRAKRQNTSREPG